jgi:hypothetical protein
MIRCVGVSLRAPILGLVVTAAAVTVAVGCSHTPSTRAPAMKPGVPCAEQAAPYLVELCAMDEPSLQEPGPETYRFVWLKTFRNPVAVRLGRSGDVVRVVTVEADAHDPKAKRRHEFTVAADAWTTLLGHLQAADFWNLSAEQPEEERGLDGADWVIEGRRAGLYHAVNRWNPGPGPFRTACEDLVKTSGLSFLPSEIR